MISYWISYKISGTIYPVNKYASEDEPFQETLWTMLYINEIGHFEEDLKVLEQHLYSKHSSDNVDVEDVVILSVSRL